MRQSWETADVAIINKTYPKSHKNRLSGGKEAEKFKILEEFCELRTFS